MKKPSRPPLVEAHQWVSVVTSVVLEMVLPIYLGSKLDEHFDLSPICTSIGVVLGMVVSITHLIRVSDSQKK